MNVKKRIKVDYSQPNYMQLTKEVIWEAIDNDVVDNKLFKENNLSIDDAVGQVTSIYTEDDNLFVDIETLPEFKMEGNPEIILSCDFEPYCSICGHALCGTSCSHWPGIDEDCKIIVNNISSMYFSIK